MFVSKRFKYICCEMDDYRLHSFSETRRDVNETLIRTTTVLEDETAGVEKHVWERNGRILLKKHFPSLSLALLVHVISEADWYSDYVCTSYIYNWYSVKGGAGGPTVEDERKTLFYEVLRAGRRMALRTLHAHNAKLPVCESEQRFFPIIHYCISNGTVLGLFLKLYPFVDVNAVCKLSGNTALHKTRCSEVVVQLLRSGACPRVLNNAGKLPIDAIRSSVSGLHFLSPRLSTQCIDCVTALQEHEDACALSCQRAGLLAAILSPAAIGDRVKMSRCRNSSCRLCQKFVFVQ